MPRASNLKCCASIINPSGRCETSELAFGLAATSVFFDILDIKQSIGPWQIKLYFLINQR